MLFMIIKMYKLIVLIIQVYTNLHKKRRDKAFALSLFPLYHLIHKVLYGLVVISSIGESLLSVCTITP